MIANQCQPILEIGMGRRARQFLLSDGDRAELERISRSRTESRQRVERARIILGCCDGEAQNALAKRLGTRPNTVSKWRGRFARLGMEGLKDAPRSGKPKRYVGLREKVLKTLETPPPKGQSAWDGLRLAEALGAKKSSIYALLQKDGVQLQRKRSWRVSTDSNFAAKAAHIIGLYLQPPERALVISVDEKPSIQALSRTTGYLQTSSGKIVRGLKSTYRRNGTLNLFAALNVATGEVIKKTTKSKTRVDFQAFMDEVVNDTPADREIYVILDNYATHKKNDEWLKAHPNVTFHFTPTSASWLNQIEIWFGILGRKALNGASFCSTEDLAKAIDDFCEVWHENAHPFVWKKREVRGSQIKNTIVNLLE
jgi:transposase